MDDRANRKYIWSSITMKARHMCIRRIKGFLSLCLNYLRQLVLSAVRYLKLVNIGVRISQKTIKDSKFIRFGIQWFFEGENVRQLTLQKNFT